MIHHRIQRIFAACSLILLSIGVIIGLATPRASAADCPGGRILSIVAHPDDDLLFQSPDILHDIRRQACLEVVYVTGGDAARDSAYIAGRQLGIQAAYAVLAGAANSWIASTLVVNGHAMQAYQMRDNPRISIRFLNLADGFPRGSGSAAYGHESLEKLWDGAIPNLHTNDGQQIYTKQNLIDTLSAIIRAYAPDTIRSLNYVAALSADPNYTTLAPGGDHSDHLTVARFVYQAHRQYNSAPQPHTLVGYVGSNSGTETNITGADLETKKAAFYAYSRHDDETGCTSDATCAQYGGAYPTLIRRQYVAARDTWDTAPWNFATADGNTTAGGRENGDTGTEPSTAAFGGQQYTFYYSKTQKKLRYQQLSPGGGVTYSTLNDPASTNFGDTSAVIAYDNALHVFYHDAANGWLRHARTTDGITWSFATADALAGHNAGNYPAVVVYGASLQVFHYDATTRDLRHTWKSSPAAAWRSEILDGQAAETVSKQAGDVGINTSAVINTDNSIQLFYADSAKGNLRHAWWNGAIWRFEDLDGRPGSVGNFDANVGISSAAAVYGSTLQVFYEDSTHASLRHAWWDGQRWRFETLDGGGSATTGYRGTSGYNPSALVEADKLHIFSYDTGLGDLRHLVWVPGANSWQAKNLDGSGGLPAERLDAAVGQASSAALFESKPHVWYYNVTGKDLRHAHLL